MSYVSISKSVRDRIVQAARETPTEIIGLLLGRFQDDTIVIEDSTTHEFSSEPHRVMLPASSIAVIADQILTGRLKGNIVGWYHSHTEGGLFYSETDIATQIRLQQFSSQITGLVVDSSTGEVGYFRVIPGTNQAVRLTDSYVTVFTNPGEAVHKGRLTPTPVPPTPTVEVRKRAPRTTKLSRQKAMAITLIALVLSLAILTAVLYRYSSTSQTPITISTQPISAATVGTPIMVLANVTGPARNVTLVYGETNGGPPTQALMNPTGPGRYGYAIPGKQVMGNISYFIKAYNANGREANTTEYGIVVADFDIQPQSSAVTVYRTKSMLLQLDLVSVNKFNGQLQLSTFGNPSGLTVSFAKANVKAGAMVGMNLTASTNAPNGTYPITIVGTYQAPQSSPITRQSVVTVKVADFQVSVTPPNDTIKAGNVGSFTVSVIIQSGFVDPVSITKVTGLPKGVNYTVKPPTPIVSAGGPSITDVTLQIKTETFTRTGTYPIVIVVTGAGVTHYLTAQIIVR